MCNYIFLSSICCNLKERKLKHLHRFKWAEGETIWFCLTARKESLVPHAGNQTRSLYSRYVKDVSRSSNKTNHNRWTCQTAPTKTLRFLRNLDLDFKLCLSTGAASHKNFRISIVPFTDGSERLFSNMVIKWSHSAVITMWMFQIKER